MGISYVDFRNDTLDKLPPAKKGDMVFCGNCGGEHPLECGTDEDGNESNLLMFYKCGEKSFLGAVAGKCTIQENEEDQK